MNRFTALIPLVLLSACGLRHLGVPPASTVQIELPVAKPRLYAVTIGQPNTDGMQQTALLDIAVGLIATAEAVDKAEQKGSRPARLTAMIAAEGDDFYADYVLDVAARLRQDGRTVSLIDLAGQPLVPTSLTPTPTPMSSRGTQLQTGSAPPRSILIIPPGSPPMSPAPWIVWLRHVEIGYDAPGLAAYFKPTASAEISLVHGPAGTSPQTIPLLVIIPTGKYHFYTFQRILRHPNAATEGLKLAAAQLAKETADVIGIKEGQ